MVSATGIPRSMGRVRYSAGNVAITHTSGPASGVAPWPGNPNAAINQRFMFKIIHPLPTPLPTNSS